MEPSEAKAQCLGQQQLDNGEHEQKVKYLWVISVDDEGLTNGEKVIEVKNDKVDIKSKYEN